MKQYEWRDLPPSAQVTYLIGLVVRSAVNLDAGSRNAYAVLAGGDRSRAETAPLPFGQRIKKMHELLHATTLTTDERLMAADALDAATAAYERRNRFIHDDLVPGDLEQERWFMARLDHKPKEPRKPQEVVTTEDLAKCDTALNRAAWRMWALGKLTEEAEAGDQGFQRRRWAHLLADNFYLDADNNISWGLD
ncbi:hypothetical protein C5C03_00380 [Clavibacter michiganensis]|uniref:hypothetical protein n=1 Tax=Clavibacter michiganensis TaxID=28447 RepID=UPI000CE82909|nr:hypothetical protein [Clavibacter michiganensis]PPF91315.1 hypothetical protein C5C03_00380 [Clavibacter michiganensis]PPF99356.1 hypothetical protein C5C05_02180 [Clavibacter michiganensis]